MASRKTVIVRSTATVGAMQGLLFLLTMGIASSLRSSQ
jgi:hypothetical protein